MPFEYKTETVMSEKELQEAITTWADKGYEPHLVGIVPVKSSLMEASAPRILLIVRKVIRKPRKKKV